MFSQLGIIYENNTYIKIKYFVSSLNSEGRLLMSEHSCWRRTIPHLWNRWTQSPSFPGPPWLFFESRFLCSSWRKLHKDMASSTSFWECDCVFWKQKVSCGTPGSLWSHHCSLAHSWEPLEQVQFQVCSCPLRECAGVTSATEGSSPTVVWL